MMRRRAHRHAGIAGFTLIEALVATALMGVVLTALAALAGQWLPNWNRGIARAQSSELVGIALERLVGDVAASQYVTPGRDAKNPLFDGTSFAVVFVRTAFGPNAPPGLEIVRIAQIKDGNETALVRSTAPFLPAGREHYRSGPAEFRRSGRASALALPGFVRLCGVATVRGKMLGRMRRICRRWFASRFARPTATGRCRFRPRL